MYKKIFLLTIMPFYVAQSTKPDLKSEPVHKDGRGCDFGRYLGVGTLQELAKHGKVPDLENVSNGLGRDIGATAIKGLASIAAEPSTKALTDDLGKNAGSTAATVLGTAAVTSTKIIAGVAVLAGTAYAADKVAERYFPSDQQKALNAEAGSKVAEEHTRTLEASLKNLELSAELEKSKGPQDFERCVSLHPKQVRNTHDCPGNCMPLYRILSLRGQQEIATKKIAVIKKLDEAPVPKSSAEASEKEVRQSFAENKQGRMRKMQATKSTWTSWLWESSSTIELPEESLQLLERRSALSPKRFTAVLADEINAKYPNHTATVGEPVLDKSGYPSKVTVHLTIDGCKAEMKTSPDIK